MTSVLGSAKKLWMVGVNPVPKNAVAFKDDVRLLYPSGSLVVLLNMEHKTQEFLSIPDNASPSALAIFPNKHYLAVAESGDKPRLVIYSLDTFKLYKPLTIPDTVKLPPSGFISVAVSHSSKYLAALCGPPDWMVIYWAWEKNKVMATAAVLDKPRADAKAFQIIFNPTDENVVSVVGENVFRCFRLTEGNLKPFGHPKSDTPDYTCHAWLSSERLICGTASGHISIFSHGDFKARIKVHSISTFNEGPEVTDNKHVPDLDEGKAVSAVISLPGGGFAAASTAGWVFLFRRLPEGEKAYYRQIHAIGLSCVQPLSGEILSTNSIPVIHTLTTNPRQDTLVAVTDSRCILSASLSEAAMKQGVPSTFSGLLEPFHGGSVVDVDISLRRPLVVTCGSDNTICLWNHETKSMELLQQMDDELSCVAIHPLGLYLLAGFPDKLRIYGIHVDHLALSHEFAVRACPDCAFSPGGHLFAAICSPAFIQVFSTITYDVVCTLRGHTAKINAVIWSEDDRRLVSCGQDGAVYEWSIPFGNRLSEVVLKGKEIVDIALVPNSNHIYAVDSQRVVRQLVDSQIRYDLDLKAEVNCLRLSRDGKMLFLGTSSGRVRSVPFPLSYTQQEFEELSAHLGEITKLCMLPDARHMVTAAADGTACLWQIHEIHTLTTPPAREIVFSTDVLVSRKELDEKMNLLQEVLQQVKEVKQESEYLLKLKELTWVEKLNQAEAATAAEIAQLKKIIKNLETELEEERHNKDGIEASLLKRITKLEKTWKEERDAELAAREEKYCNLLKNFDTTKEQHQRTLQQMHNEHQQNLEGQREEFEECLLDKEAEIKQLKSDWGRERMEAQEWRDQMEEETDREILNLMTKCEQRLRQRDDSITKMKTELSLLKKKCEQNQKAVLSKEEEAKKWRTEAERLERLGSTADKEMNALRFEIRDREETIHDREKQLFRMKRKSQQAEKAKEVLQERVDELKQQLQPKTVEISDLKERVAKLENDLAVAKGDASQMKSKASTWQQKYAAAARSLKQENEKYSLLHRRYETLKTEVLALSSYLTQSRQLRESVQGLCDTLNSRRSEDER